MRFIRQLFDQRTPTFDQALIAPSVPFYAIGDVHGCDDLLSALLARIDGADPDATIICVGDYIDRGPDSAGVLRRLFERCQMAPGRFICLKGNHEDMFLSFLDKPATDGPRWLSNGGEQTMASFGIEDLAETADEDAMIAGRDRLLAAMGQDLAEWLQNLPLHWRSGDVAVVHAGADPACDIDDQVPATLMWGHRAFATTRRRDGVWVVHGHTVMDSPRVATGHISIDTGAYATGRLTAAHITGGNVKFIQT